MSHSLKGTIIIITGSNAGIGFETAKALARQEATIVLACRDEARANASRSLLIQDLKQRGTPEVEAQNQLVFLPLDLTSFASVREFAKQFRARFNRLDILINNAAIMPPEAKATVDGFEVTFQVNYLSPFLLTALLIPSLRATALARENAGHPLATRIVNVGAKSYAMGKLDLTRPLRDQFLADPKSFSTLNASMNSKLALALYTRVLARKLKDAEVAAAGRNQKIGRVTANVLHPGLVHTNIGRNWFQSKGIPPWLESFIVEGLMFPWKSSIEEGIQTTLYCALSDQIENSSGQQFFQDSRGVSFASAALDDALAEKLWSETEIIVGLRGDGLV